MRGRVALGLLVLVSAGCGSHGPPDFRDARSVSEALNAGGVACELGLLDPEATFDATSAATCVGDGFTVQIFVYASHANLAAHIDQAHVFWCDNGVTSGVFVGGDRWFTTFEEPPSDLPDGLGMSDLAAATGGKYFRQHCDAA